MRRVVARAGVAAAGGGRHPPRRAAADPARRCTASGIRCSGTRYDGRTRSASSVLLVGKMLASSLTIGIGGSGGVFAPSLFFGAMLGSAFGTAHGMFPDVAGHPVRTP